jgi:elongation factor 1-gamma
MPSYTLHAPAGSFRAFSALIAAEYNGVDVKVADFDAKAVAAMSPTGKAPVLVLPSGETLFSSHAIARYIAGIRRDVGLTGASLAEQGTVDAWMDFCSSELDLPACVWFYPAAGYMPFNKDA